jgi:translation initiation factor IF-2
MVEIRQVFHVSKVGDRWLLRARRHVVKRNSRVRLLRNNVVSGTASWIRSSASRTTSRKFAATSNAACRSRTTTTSEGDQLEVYEIQEVARSL